MPSLVDLGGSGAPKKKLPFQMVTNKAPDLTAAAARRASAPPAIHPLVSAPRPQSTPKPPPVVVSNKQGNYTRPAPPPSVQAGPIAPVAHKSAPPPQIKKAPINNPRPAPVVKAPPTAAPVAPVNTPAPAAPPPPGLDQYLAGDTTYQGVMGQNQSALAQFLAQQQQDQTGEATSFAEQLRQLQQSQGLDQNALQEDYAGRGLLQSGVYADALTGLQQQYQDSQNNLNSQHTGYAATLQQQLADYQAQLQQAAQQAQADAVARRAAQYGL